jgi:uncharacterized protein YgiM (DUF1202 family)
VLSGISFSSPVISGPILKDISNIISTTNIISERLKNIKINWNEISINTDGTIQLNRENITDEVKEEITNHLRIGQIDRAVTITEFNEGITKITETINHNSNMSNKLALVILLISILFTNILPLLYPANTSTNNIYVQQNIQIIASMLCQQQARRVTVNNLKVYKEPNKRARVNGTLPKGQVVHVIIKDRNWCHITTLVDGEVLSGWVFTRYIEKIQIH